MGFLAGAGLYLTAALVAGTVGVVTVTTLVPGALGDLLDPCEGWCDPHPHDTERDHRFRAEAPFPPVIGGGDGGSGPGGPAETAVSAGLVAMSLAAIAYYWPALRFSFTPLVVPLFTRIDKDAALGQQTRERMYKLIREKPGIHAHAVARELDVGWSTAVYHLRMLEDRGLVVSRRTGRYRCFFVVGDALTPYPDALAVLRNATARTIARVVAERPGIVQKEVCASLAISSSLASWHLSRLERAGVVEAERVGRWTRYRPGPLWTSVGDGASASVADPAA